LRTAIGYLLELAGLAAIVGGLFIVAMWLGLIATGLVLVLIGASLGGKR